MFLFIIYCTKKVHKDFFFSLKNSSTLNLITSATSPLYRELIVLVNGTKPSPHSHRRELKNRSPAFIHRAHEDPRLHPPRWALAVRLRSPKPQSTARIWTCPSSAFIPELLLILFIFPDWPSGSELLLQQQELLLIQESMDDHQSENKKKYHENRRILWD